MSHRSMQQHFALFVCRIHLPLLENEAAAAEVAAAECARALQHAAGSEAEQQHSTDALQKEWANLDAAHKTACRRHSQVDQ